MNSGINNKEWKSLWKRKRVLHFTTAQNVFHTAHQGYLAVSAKLTQDAVIASTSASAKPVQDLKAKTSSLWRKKPNDSKGTGKTTPQNSYELVRFCNHRDTSVVGGASKLFQHFLKAYHPEVVRSFSDVAHTKGHLYETLGFQYIHTSDPGYVWVSLKDDIAYSRLNAQKRNVRKFFGDETIDLSLTEREIMESHGFVRVFDSGVKLWEWTC